MQKINILTQETIKGASTEQLTEIKELLEQKLAAVNKALN
jgi:ParB family transcriptional regulator, chromosome partitioning protein